MRQVHIQGVPVHYDAVGDGFPLLLLPGPTGAWEPTIPLFGELCRVIAYETSPLQGTTLEAVPLVEALRQTLGLERLYMASREESWPLALEFALQYPQRLEGLILLGIHPVNPDRERHLLTLATRLSTLTTPTLLLSTARVRTTSPVVDILCAHLPRYTTQVLADASASAPPNSLALQAGHATMAFLLQCERQRNLVRGASFLL
jgi:pimeloyl-ACP methyl ester carboxylesterase